MTDLANYYDMSLNAVSKHIKVLESTGLVKRKNIGRTHWIEANPQRLTIIESWLQEQKSIWDLRLSKLDEILTKGDN